MEPTNVGLVSRINEVTKENLVPLPPLRKWLTNIKVVSIEEATMGIPVPEIEIEVETAKNYALMKLKETETNLTVDEIAALILYTSEWPEQSQSLYYQLNKWLRDADRRAAVPFFKYLVLLLSGLSKLSPYEGMVYRGVRQNLREIYQSKKDKNLPVVWNGLSSTTIKLGVLQSFLGNSGHGTMFHIHSKSARKISDFSIFQKEEEALFFPLSQFEIDSLFVHGDLTIVSLQEVDPIEKLVTLFSNITLGGSSPSIGVVPNTASPKASVTPLQTMDFREDAIALVEKWDSLLLNNPNKLVMETTIYLQSYPNSFVAFYYRARAKRALSGYVILDKDKGDWDDAFKLASKKKQESPSNIEAHWITAEYYRNLGEDDNAIQDASTAIKLNPNFDLAYRTRGDSYKMKGEYDKAIQDASTVIKLNPNYYLAYRTRGDSYRMKGEYDNAIQDASTAIKLNPNFDLAYCTRGDSYEMKGEYDKAIQDASTVIKLNPNYYLAYYTRGEAYRMKGEYDKAIQDASTAIKLNPNYYLAYHTRGEAYRMKGEYDRAIQDASTAIKLNPNYDSAYYTRGEAYRIKGEYDRAIQDASTVIKLNPNYGQAYGTRGSAYRLMGNKNAALRDLQKAIELNPNYKFAQEELKKLK